MKWNGFKKLIVMAAIIGTATLHWAVVLPGQDAVVMAEAKTKKVSLSASKKSLVVGKSFTLTLQNSSKPVEWSASPKAVVALRRVARTG